MDRQLTIEIDEGSGFCFGVTTAIRKAEEELAKGTRLYCLGDIVHNGMEVKRLHDQGLITINHDDMEELKDVKVLLRAHGEPPQTYELARRNGIEIIDATCPVVLALQRRIKRQYDDNPNAQIVISASVDMQKCLVWWVRRTVMPSLWKKWRTQNDSISRATSIFIRRQRSRLTASIRSLTTSSVTCMRVLHSRVSTPSAVR